MFKSKTKFKDFVINIDKQTFINYYFFHSKKDTLKFFNLGTSVFNRFMKYYNIKKPKDLIYNIRKETNIQKYGIENPFKDNNKIKAGYIKKHGSLKAHYDSNIAKIRKNVEIKGVRWTNQTLAAIEQRKVTCLKKYDVDEYVKSRQAVIEKRRKACEEKFGEDYYINQVKLICDKLSSKANSNLNNAFANYLTQYGLPFTREFKLGNFIYDFQLGKYLLEINPYCTHNSTWGLFGKPKPEQYHRDKSLNAQENGYICIHIFDWMDADTILYNIINKTLKVVDTEKAVKHIFDYKKMELVNKESENTVIIYDDGFDIII